MHIGERRLPKPWLMLNYLIEEVNDTVNKRIVNLKNKINITFEISTVSFDTWNNWL